MNITAKNLLKSLLCIFLLGNTAVSAQNAGFEDISGNTSWNSFSVTDWNYGGTYEEFGAATSFSILTANPYIYNGSNAIAVKVKSSSQWATLNSTNYSVKTPAGSGYYVHVVVFATDDKKSKTEIALGVNDGSSNTWGSATTIGNNGFASYSYTMSASGNTTYKPAIRVKKTHGSDKVTVGLDNVVIYYDQKTDIDSISPSVPKKIKGTINSGKVKLQFTEGEDDSKGSGIGGYLVLRHNGAGKSLPSVANKALYSSKSKDLNLLDVSLLSEKWNVLYNDSTNNGLYTDDIQSGITTYLVYMRDNANNYSDPLRVLVVNGDYGSYKDINIDGLTLVDGTFTNQKEMTFNEGATVTNAGGKLSNNSFGTINISANTDITVAKLDNGNGTIKIKKDGSLTITDSLENKWINSTIEIEKGGKLTVGKNASFTLSQGKLSMNGTATIDGTLNWKTGHGNFSNSAGTFIFKSGSRYNHLGQGNTIPVATWEDGSTVALYGETWYSTSIPANLDQNFFNVVWDWTNQGKDLDLGGKLSTIRGNFTVNNTNGMKLNLHASGNGKSIKIDSTINVINGMLLTGVDTLLLSETASISEGASNYIKGNVKTSRSIASLNTDHAFGNIGIKLNFHGALPGNISINRVNDSHVSANGATSIDLRYEIYADVNDKLNATMTIEYRDSDLNGLDENTLVFFRAPNHDNNWKNMGISTRDTANNVITLTGINGFSDWTAAPALSPLPVTMKSFTVTDENPAAVLDWTTITEQNNKGFEVERSFDGTNWEMLAEVAGHGTTLDQIDYNYTDYTLPLQTATAYYRLRQVDFNGEFEYTKVVVLRRQATSATTTPAQIWVDSRSKEIKMNLQDNQTRATVQLLDMSGKIVLEQQAAQGFGTASVSCQSLPNGMYVIVLTQGTERMVKKIIF